MHLSGGERFPLDRARNELVDAGDLRGCEGAGGGDVGRGWAPVPVSK
jgi:hypothetical protein